MEPSLRKRQVSSTKITFTLQGTNRPAQAAEFTEGHLGRAELSHPDFFHAQIVAQVEREASRRRVGRSWPGLPRLALGGIASLAAGLAIFVVLIPHGDLSNPRTGYVAEALKAKTLNPKVTTAVNSQKDMTIINLEGLHNLPADKDLNR